MELIAEGVFCEQSIPPPPLISYVRVLWRKVTSHMQRGRPLRNPEVAEQSHKMVRRIALILSVFNYTYTVSPL